jgi:hypothetical protein
MLKIESVVSNEVFKPEQALFPWSQSYDFWMHNYNASAVVVCKVGKIFYWFLKRAMQIFNSAGVVTRNRRIGSGSNVQRYIVHICNKSSLRLN